MNKVNEMNGLTCLGAGTFPLDNLLMKHADGSVETIYQQLFKVAFFKEGSR